MNHLSLQNAIPSKMHIYRWKIINNINGEHEVTCLLVVISAATFVNKHGSVVVFLSKCLDLIVIYVLNGGHPTQLHGEKKIIIETREKCETIKRSPPSKWTYQYWSMMLFKYYFIKKCVWYAFRIKYVHVS